MKYLLILLWISVLPEACARAADGDNAATAHIDSVNSLSHEFIVSNLYKSIALLSDNAAEAERTGYTYGEGIACSHLAKALYLNGKYEESTTMYLRAIKILEELSDPVALSETYGEYGYQLKRTNIERANYFLRTGIAVAEKNSCTGTLSTLYDNYGVLKEMEGRVDSAMFYYARALAIKEERRDRIGIPYSLNKLAGAYLILRDYPKAFEYLTRSDAYREKESGDFGKLENMVIYGDAYAQMHNTEGAIAKYAATLDLARKTGVNYTIRYCYEQLTALYKEKGDYRKAFENYALLNAYKDSVLNKEVREKIAQLEVEYEAEKKDHDIALNRFELNRKTTQIYSLSGISVAVIIFSFIAYTAQKKRREREKTELELSGKLKHAELEKRIVEEKLRISRELHDNIGSQITFIVSSLDNYIYAANETHEVNKLSQLSSFGRETLKELRNTIWALKHEDSDIEELIVKITELAQIISDHNQIDVSVTNLISTRFELSSMHMVNIYRIIQEALQNTIKYSSASRATIQFREREGGFDLIIADDGIGFDPGTVKANNGLLNMKFRCEESHGVYSLESSSAGTTITCRFTTG
jgi:signal transduction histidine kinase